MKKYINKDNIRILISLIALLLIVLFGSCITGAGMGLAIKNGGSTGGIDILQNICLKYLKMPLSTSLIIFDGIIVLGGATISGDFNNILYGILFIVISGYILDNIVFGGFNVRAAYVVTTKYEEIKQAVFSKLDRGITEIYTRGGYSQTDKITLLCVLSNREYYYLRSIALEIDPNAFIFVTKASEVHGEGFTYERKHS